MSEEVQVPAEAQSAPEQEATAALESVVEQPVAESQPEEKPARTFTQEELEAAIGKRLAREQRKWEREQQARLAQVQAPPKDIALDQFESPEAYAEALAIRKAEELLDQRERQKQQSVMLDAYHEREEEARGKYDDFEQVAYNPRVPITDVMAETIRASDIGPDVAYYLGSNVKEAERIARLSPFLQAKEIGKIEVKLSDNPPVKKSTSAPAPITPVTARTSSNNPSYDTTDPRSIKTMSTSEWIEAERQRQIRKLQAQNR